MTMLQKKSSLSLQAYGSGLMAFIAIKILAPVFLSRGDTKTPVKAGIAAMTSNILLNLILAYYYGHVGLAAATSISALINAALLYYFLVKQSIFKFNAAFYKMLYKVILASIIMVLYIYYSASTIDHYLQSSMMERVTMTSEIIIISALIYFFHFVSSWSEIKTNMTILHCIKLDKDLESLDRAPYPGELGKRILENVSKEAWQMWLDHQTMLINENNLNLFETSSQNYLKEQMEKILFFS